MPIDTYPATTQHILVTIKRSREATVSDLAERLGLSEAGIRGPLSLLEASGLVQHRLVGRGPGRRKHSYLLTDAGNSVFPDHSSDMWTELVDFLENNDPDVLRSFWLKIGAERTPVLLRDIEVGDPAAARKLGAAYERKDFLADVEEEGDDLVVRVFHCPYLKLAIQQPVVCDIERETLMKAMEGSYVDREAHQLLGDQTCVYRIMRKAAHAR